METLNHGILRFNDECTLKIDFDQATDDMTVTRINDATGEETVITGNIPEGWYSLADIASGNEPSGIIDITGLNFAKDCAFYGCKNITEVKGKTSVLTPNCFQNCTGIENIHIELTGDSGGGNYFIGCTKLKTAVFLQNITYTGTFGIFNGCTSLEIADLMAKTLGNNTFYNNQKLKTLILRNTAAITKFPGSPAFSMTQFKENGTGGTLYVPQSMISAYEANSDWITLLSYPNNQILPIEGSIYEHAYADGTPIE